ncbi:magnesium transporter [Trinickia violacea]|uniref:Magnesium transporter n=1 Tax=Trinickia violacea TaxID=2571746 RepID=A0A4P8ISA3_9BURK|nr:CorA family divalent cation transporter [Trinickia violacea]QCP49874.1 magnesium transporter [Trinickia violacea]
MATELQAAHTSDHIPLKYGYLFSENGVGREIDAATATEWLSRPNAARGEFVWLHFHDIPSMLTQWPPQLAAAPAAFGDALRKGYRTSRLMRTHQNLIAVLNDVDYDSGRERSLEIATLWLNVDARCLLSVRNLPLRSVERLRHDVVARQPFHSPMALLNRLLHEQADVLSGIARDALRITNEVERALGAGKLPKRSSLGKIRRDLVQLRRLLAPEPAMLFRLANRAPEWMREEDAQSLLQCAEQFALVLRDTAALEERIRLLQEEIASRVGEHTNRSILILTSATVIALPITLISGLLGMNIGGLPFKEYGGGFWVVLVITVLLTGLAAWLTSRLMRD